MKNRKILSYTIIGLSFVFILTYLFDGIKEIFIPFKGLGFPYKSPIFYILKLLYACLFLLGGIDLLKNRNRAWCLMMFSSIGMLISCGLFYFNGYIFRTALLDLFFLEVLSFFIIILFNISFFVKKNEIFVPNKKLILLGTFIIFNLIVNYGLIWLLFNYCWICCRV
jgi:hypothetical protein